MNRPFQRLLRIFLLPLAFLLAPAPGWILAAREQEEPMPSISVGKVSESPPVLRGGTVEILVQGVAPPRDTVQFKIRKRPKHGKLEGPRQLSNDTASFLYRHDGKKGIDLDEFRISLQTSPGNAWGTVPVQVTIMEPPSRLVVHPDSLDFGGVPIGESRRQPLRISNGGGGLLAGRVEIGPPWAIEGVPKFSLAEGEARDFDVVFSPEGPGERRGSLSVESSASPGAIPLRGEGIYRFAAPERIAFEQKADADRLDLTLENLVDTDLPLAITAEPPLRSAEFLVLPARGRAVLQLGLEKKEHHSQKFARLEIRDGPATRAVRVDLPPPPARLEWKEDLETPREYEPGSRPLLEFHLENKGLTSAENVKVRAGAGGLVPVPYREPILSIESGGNATIAATWDLPPEPGEVEAVLIASHGGLEETLRVKARVVAAPTSVTQQQPMAKILRPAVTDSDVHSVEIPEITEVFLLESTPHSIAIRWAVPSPNVQNFVIERRKIQAGPDGAPVEEWTRWGPVNIEVSGDTATARFRKLPAATFWYIRIRSMVDGKLLSPPPSKIFRMETRPLPPLLPDWFLWAVAPVGAALLYGLWKKIRAARSARSVDLDTRIKNLGQHGNFS